MTQPPDNLTDKQRRFCEEYVVDWNATQAAIRAGYSEKTAHVTGQENLRKPIIQEYIERCKNDVARLAGVSAVKIAKVFTEIAFDDSGERKDSDRIKAAEALNKMFGTNAPDKIEHSGGLTVQVVRQSDISEPTTSEDDIDDDI